MALPALTALLSSVVRAGASLFARTGARSVAGQGVRQGAAQPAPWFRRFRGPKVLEGTAGEPENARQITEMLAGRPAPTAPPQPSGATGSAGPVSLPSPPAARGPAPGGSFPSTTTVAGSWLPGGIGTQRPPLQAPPPPPPKPPPIQRPPDDQGGKGGGVGIGTPWKMLGGALLAGGLPHVVKGLALVFEKLGISVEQFGSGLIEGQRHLRIFNTSIANQFAEMERQEMVLAVRRGAATSASSRELTDEIKEWKERTAPMRNDLTDIKNLIGAHLLGVLNDMAEVVSVLHSWVPIMDAILWWLGRTEDEDKKHTVMDFLSAMGRGEWDAPPKQPKNQEPQDHPHRAGGVGAAAGRVAAAAGRAFGMGEAP